VDIDEFEDIVEKATQVLYKWSNGMLSKNEVRIKLDALGFESAQIANVFGEAIDYDEGLSSIEEGVRRILSDWEIN
jgi:hypothetical protein